IVDENHYYPFGLRHEIHYPSSRIRDFRAAESLNGGQVGDPVKLVNVTETEYMYKFGGKELQDELGLNIYDFEARNYMPDIGRTTTQDPLADSFAHQSPYSFFNNNPIYFKDPTGMAGEDWYDDGNGNLKYNPNLTEANASTVLKGNESYVGKTPSVADNSGS